MRRKTRTQASVRGWMGPLEGNHLKLFVLAIIYLLTGSAYILVTPVLEKPDEEGHYGYIRYLRENQTLAPVDHDDPWLVESKQPPLYYVTASLLTAWLPDYQGDWELITNPYLDYSVPGYRIDNRNVYLHPPDLPALAIGVRVVSLILGLGVMLFAYKSAELLSPTASFMPLAVAALVGFQPKFMYVMTAVNNDAAVNFLGAVLFYVLLYRLCKHDTNAFIDRYFAVVVGVLLGLSSIAKVNGLVFIPLTGLALLFIHRKPGRAFWWDCLIIGVLTLAIGGWWYARNAWLYHDPLLLNAHAQGGSEVVRPLWGRLIPDLLGLEHTFWANQARSFISETRIDRLLIWWGRLVMVLLIITVLRKRADMKSNWPAFATLISWPLTFFVLLIGYWNRKARWSFGRLLLPASVPLGLLFAYSWWYGQPRTQRLRWRKQVFTLGVAFVITSTALTPFISIYPLYHPWTAYKGGTTETPVNVVYTAPKNGTDIARLIDYEFLDSFALPGTYTPVELCWEPLGHTTAPYSVLVQLLDVARVSQNQLPSVWGVRTTYPGLGNLPTDRWEMGQTFCDKVFIYVDAETPTPLGLALEVGLIDQETNTRLPAYGPDGGTVGLLALPGIPVLDAPPEASTKISAGNYVFGEALVLLDVELSQAFDGYVQLALIWQVLEPVAYDATMFVHALDADGNILAQADQQPLAGQLPTSYWVTGQVIEDFVIIDMHAAPSDDISQIVFGMYTWPSMERIPVTDDAGQPLADHVLRIDVPGQE